MKRLNIPRHEPEVVRSAARKQNGDDEKIATTSIDGLDFKGVHLSSRYGKADEYEDMAAILDGIDPDYLDRISSIWCDSKATACYSVALEPCSASVAKKIADALDGSAETHCGGHNGIYVEGANGGQIVVDPNWQWGDAD